MKRMVGVALLVCLSPLAAPAQLGKTITIPAGSPEDRALLAIEGEPDAEKKLEMLQRFVQEFSGDARLLGLRRLQGAHLRLGELDQSILRGLEALRLDPGDFSTLANLVRAFAQKGDAAQAFTYGVLAANLVQRLKTMPPPEGTTAEIWESQKANLLEQAQPDYQFLEYSLYEVASRQTDLAVQAELFERFLAAFPDSSYLAAAYQVCLGAYQRAGNPDKVLEVGEKVLASQPDNVVANLLLADALSEMGQHLDRADALAQRLPELADKASQPEGKTAEEWATQKNTWKGLAYSIQGLILMHQAKDAEGVTKFREADPLLAGEPVAKARNLFRLGYAYAKLGRLDPARRYLMEAVAIESPYKGVAQDLLNKVNEQRAKRGY